MVEGMTDVLDAVGLTKRYRGVPALDGLDLTLPAGSIHGLLGPNGAGKSTAVRVLATLLRPDAGRATIAGHDLLTDARGVRSAIGLVGQTAAVDEVLSGRQNLVLFARLGGVSRGDATRRATELLGRFDLEDAADRSVSTYSGGMRRKLDIAVTLLRRPALLFLDEPTTGLDPRARAEVWSAVRRIAHDGTAVLLTTQYLDEADHLADRITVLGAGRVLASDAPDTLKRRLGPDRIVVTLPAGSLDTAEAALEGFDGTSVDAERSTATVDASGGPRTLLAVLAALERSGVTPEDVLLRRPTLDEVFLALTDKELR